MQINVRFEGGKCNGKFGQVLVERFTIGMQIRHDGEYYTVQDGPVAMTFQKNQEGHDHLGVRAVFEGMQPAG